MKKVLMVLLFVTDIFFISCSGSKKIVKTNETGTVGNAAAVADGSSFEKAIIINATNDFAGIRAEYDWLKMHYPGAKTKSQSLNHKDKKSYDILNIVTADNQEKAVYFDITSTFGKF